eukprot:761556-Hanusia_phi.AAC.7
MYQTKHSSSLHVEILEEDKKTMQQQISSLEEDKAKNEVNPVCHAPRLDVGHLGEDFRAGGGRARAR